MILAMDVGNTSIVIGGLEDGEVRFEGWMNTDRVKTADQYCIELKLLLEIYRIDLQSVEGAIVSSVVPPVLGAMKRAIRRLIGKDPLVVGPGLKTGLKLAIENPAQTGADLVVGSVAALREYGPPLIVVDMGTATTMTVLDPDGAMIGGSICPGVGISLDALTQRTALLPGLQLEQPSRAVGRNTVECMRSGVMLGTASMLDGMIDRFQEELGYPCTLVGTGGMAQFILPLCRHQIVYDRHLLLKGLGILYRENQPR